MKIWFQSCGAFGKDQVWNAYEQALEEHLQKTARPDTLVELHGVEETIPGIGRYSVSHGICEVQSIRNAIRAEREGYDAFVTISAPDVGFDRIREVVDIPTVFMLQNAIHFALMFAPRFAFLSHNDSLLVTLEEATKQYGLAERMVPGGYLDLDHSDWPDMFGNPDSYKDSFVGKVREIIARGADIIIASPLPLSLWLLKQGLTKFQGARVLDHFGCAVKMAELMVDLKQIGITRKIFTPPSKELLVAIQKLYE
jgi:allantoin racemase